jgi:hypothetical protein
MDKYDEEVQAILSRDFSLHQFKDSLVVEYDDGSMLHLNYALLRETSKYLVIITEHCGNFVIKKNSVVSVVEDRHRLNDHIIFQNPRNDATIREQIEQEELIRQKCFELLKEGS